MTRGEMHCEALAVEMLIEAAMAVHGTRNVHDAFELLELAHTRAGKLHEALDSIYAQEGAA